MVFVETLPSLMTLFKKTAFEHAKNGGDTILLPP
jgi:hypothetical protein